MNSAVIRFNNAGNLTTRRSAGILPALHVRMSKAGKMPALRFVGKGNATFIYLLNYS